MVWNRGGLWDTGPALPFNELCDLCIYVLNEAKFVILLR